MARKKGTPALSVDITDDMHDALKLIAKEQFATVSHIVRDALRKYIAKHK